MLISEPRRLRQILPDAVDMVEVLASGDPVSSNVFMPERTIGTSRSRKQI